VAERRSRLRAVAESAGPATEFEVLHGADATPAGVAAALGAGTLGLGQRVIVVDGAERFKEADVQAHLGAAMQQMPASTTVAFFACEDKRVKAPPALHRAVSAAGGNVAREALLTPGRLRGWVTAQARALSLALDDDAAAALVAQVGERRQRLQRELEKLALELVDPAGDGPSQLDANAIDRRAAHSAELEAYALADALVTATAADALGIYVRLHGQGERLPRLLGLMAMRLRQALAAAVRLQAGEPVAVVRRGLSMPNAAAERLMAEVRGVDPRRLQRALGVLADLELHTRGGPIVHSARPAVSALHEDTQAVRAIEAIVGGRA
jgi:DNA polymerase-3 subunit delta